MSVGCRNGARGQSFAEQAFRSVLVGKLVVVLDVAEGADRHPHVPEDENDQAENDQKLPKLHNVDMVSLNWGGKMTQGAGAFTFLLTPPKNVYTLYRHKASPSSGLSSGGPVADKKDKKDKKEKKKKKDSQLVIRVTADERDAFVSLCDALDTSASREIRRFMKRFVQEQKQAAKD